MIRVFVGWDPREAIAYEVLQYSIHRHASKPVSIVPVRLDQLGALYQRERDPLQSTEFSFSRFLVPYLCDYEGWAIFMDCDMLCTADIAELWALRNDKYAIMSCQPIYTPRSEKKFLNQAQTKYEKKNWSSLMLMNCAKCTALTPEYVNTATGLQLHQFKWLEEGQLGKLPNDWNWLVGEFGLWNSPLEQDAPPMSHYTLGGPWFADYFNCDYAHRWREYYYRLINGL